MTVIELLARLDEKNVALSVTEDELVVRGEERVLDDPSLLTLLRENKKALVELIKAGRYAGLRGATVDVPANRIPPACNAITPEMLPLVKLTSDDIERIVATIPGGAANVQDIYPLVPLQEGMLFHHLMAKGDPYLLRSLHGFETRAGLDRYLQAVQAVIDRHDILRTAVLWEGLPEPVQVVWRHATLVVEEVTLDSTAGEVAQQLSARFDARHYRLDIRQAPLMRVCVAWNEVNERWVTLELNHHLSVDHTALEIMQQEIQAHLQGQAGRLSEPLPFRNFVAQARLGISREEHETFFRSMLGDVEESTAPFGLTDVQGDGSGITEAWRIVGAQLAKRLRERARVLGVSTASLCHLAWAQVLSRVSGRDDVVFGTLLFGRMQGGEGAARVLGLFINTLPIRIRVGGESVQDSARQTHALLAQLLRHEHAPLTLMQRCSAVAAPTPLFSALLNYRHNAATGSAPAPTEEEIRTAVDVQFLGSEERTNYPFTLNVDDFGEDFGLNAQVQSPIDPDRICAYMQTALEQLVDALENAPATPMRSLDVLSAAERRQLLEEWNATQADYPHDKCIHELFEAQAAREPGAAAVEDDGEQLSYRELNGQANQLAHHLLAVGVMPGARVAIVLDRSMELVQAELAVLKCGAVYVPLDRNAPAERLAFMLEDCQAGLVLSAKGVPLPAMAGVDRIDLDALDLTDRASHNPAPASDSGAAAYVIYTSGSTGQPKGVIVSHRSVGALVLNNGYAHFEAEDRAAFTANPAFDASTLEVWAPLLHGGCLVVISQAVLLDPQALVERLRAQQVNILQLVAGLLSAYAAPLASIFPGLRYLITGGDVADVGAIARILSNSAPQHLIQTYGPTETTTFATAWDITAVAEGGKSIPIGRPIANSRIYLLDGHGQPAPTGVAAEIHIGGAGVGLGYLNRPELTAERFVADPFAGAAGARMYKTGDLGRYLSDGNIEFLGRNDHQVKLRGFRIELGEIEARLGAHPAIRDAAVVAREDSPGEKRLVAYYTLEQGGSAGAEALRTYLSTLLPEYMVPAAYVELEALPLTPNGKLDRKALPAPESTAYAAGEYAAPEGEIETALAQIWADVLKLERVGRHDDFFALGGHSLLVMKVVSRVRQTLGMEISLTELFVHTTLTKLAQALKNAARSVLPPITLAPRDQPLALSFAQQRLWFLCQMEGVSQAYHMPMGLHLTGELDREALRRALDRIVARHEALRTTFILADGEPVQRIAPEDSGFALQEYDLREHPDTESELERLAAQGAMARFDFETGPLIRGRLIQLSHAEHVLLITMHHIVSDGWSMGILINEFSALYGVYCRGLADPLPALAIQYADYAAWQRRWVDGAVLQAQTEYWQRTLAGAPALLELPTDRPRPAQQDHAGATIGLELDERLSTDLKALSRRHGATPFMTLFAGWAILLARLSDNNDMVIGTPVANRRRGEIEPLIGFFLNTLALRVDLSGSPTVAQLLQRVKAQTLAAQEHQDLPFEQVVEIAKPPRSLAHSPLFQVLFNWQNTEEGELDLPGLTVAPVGPPYDVAQYDLALNLFEMDGCIVGGLTYATALFDSSSVARILGYFRAVLQAITTDEHQEIDRLPLLPAAERDQLLEQWNATGADYPHDKCIHELFEAQAAGTPDAVAVLHEDSRLTYGELNARANRLAHHLRASGIGPDTLVAICIERGPDMIVGLLGILKAGGAYVPLDPAYPAERLAHMLEDSAPALLLTQHSLREKLPAHRASFCIDTDWVRLDHASDQNLPAAALPPHLAYVIYTSGSTGKPKGVAITHRAAGNFLAAMGQQPGIAAGDVLLAVTSLSFDIAGLELYLPLASGATVVCASREDAADPSRLSALVRRHGVSMMQATPSTWRMFVEQDWSGFAHRLTVLCGGEALPADLAQALLERVPVIWNMYGPTETTIWSTVHGVTAPGTPSIGRPIANTQIYLLDRHLNPVPLGVPGELHIGGDGLARGYLHRPDLTAEKFIACPFGATPGERMYKTGDLARWLPDGTIDCLGRLDHQVKIRGFRIELGEIESALARHPQVKECVVVAREDTPGDKRLAAYVVPQEISDAASSVQTGNQVTFSMFYFGAETYEQDDKYRLYMESAKFADQNGFEAVWTPERHFHEVGSLYPNPAILSAALASVTKQVRLRAGSVVLPLHHPIRVAEEWSVVDNLSQGRVGISIASGWHPRDFVLAPDSFDGRKEAMATGIQTLKALWRGEPLSFNDGTGKQSSIRIFPKPVQPQLPLWITAAGNPDTFLQAGSLGANVLTHLLGQTMDQVAANIALYRDSLEKHGFDPNAGKVTMMIHTFVGEDFDQTLAHAREPFTDYMRSHLGLLDSFAKSLDIPAEQNVVKEDVEGIVSFAFERYSRTASLIGTPQTCLEVVNRLREIGVDEMACLIDWMDSENALAGLPHLQTLQQLSRKTAPGTRELQKYLKTTLPGYMLPSSIMFLDSLPLTPNGKLDRKALPAPGAAAYATREYEAPQGEVEIKLAQIWADVLKLERVGRHDDFFELGGHSLLAMTLIQRMHQEGLHADVRTFFVAPTLAELAAATEDMEILL